MPRTPLQALGFLLGFWVALLLSPLTIELARADDGRASPFAELEASLLSEVNAVRARHHLIPLRRNTELDAVARSHSDDMARRGYLSHHSPEGTNPVDRIFGGGVAGFTLAAENLGKTNRGDPNREIVQSWLRSPDHRRNLLSPPFNTTGIGIARSGDGSLVYTQIYITIPRDGSAR
jgi:uncharacterized protein YkwD